MKEVTRGEALHLRRCLTPAHQLQTALVALTMQECNKLRSHHVTAEPQPLAFPPRQEESDRPSKVEIPSLCKGQNIPCEHPMAAHGSGCAVGTELCPGCSGELPARASTAASPSTQTKTPLQTTPGVFAEDKICEGAGPGRFSRLERGEPDLCQPLFQGWT